jgi:hypothetical protein
MATIVRFKNILGGSLGDTAAGVNLVSTYRDAYSGDGGASLDFNAVRTDFKLKLIVDLKNRFQPVYGYTSAKIVSASSVTTRIGIQIIFNPAGFGGDYVSYTDNAGITFDSSPDAAINRWQQGDISTNAYTTTQQIINLGISAAASIMPGGSNSPTKGPIYFTDGTTMGMVLHPAISFDGVPTVYFYNQEYPIPLSAFQLAFADQWSSATRTNGYIFFGEGGRGEGGWQLQGTFQLSNTGLGPFINAGEGILPIWSNYENSSVCGPFMFSQSNHESRWFNNTRIAAEGYGSLC